MADETSTEALPLAAEFAAATHEDWVKLVDGVLKGRSFDRLVSRSYDQIPVGPIYARAAKAVPLAARAAALPWRIMQRLDHPDPAQANTLALEDLENGATGLTLIFSGAAAAYGYGLAPTPEAVAQALEGVHLDAGIALELDLPADAEAAVDALTALVAARKVEPSSIDARFGLDPIGAMAHQGWARQSWNGAAAGLAARVVRLALAGFKGPFVVADARPVHAAGGSEVQELGFALAVAVAYLRALESGGMHLDAARRTIFFRFAADADQFLTMAKLRALRRLWARAEDACGLVPQPVFVSTETAWRMMTQRDPHVNMLRTTMAAFSAAVGGADAITVLPYTMAAGLPDSFARRVARNGQLLLAEESSLAKVVDPGAGSGALEELTERLCVAAWNFFQEIERAGGAAAALESGLIQSKVAGVRSARERAVGQRADVLTGTTEFPNLAEGTPAVLAVRPVATERAPPGAERVTPLASFRLAEPFEALREAADRMRAATGLPPRVFLATLGTAADFTPRATFARSFFEAGGVEAVGGERFTDLVEIASAFKASGAKVACLCSSDEVYAEEAEGAARLLAEAGAAQIYFAGRPGEREDALKQAGVEGFVHAGCDALTTLQAVHATLAKR